MSEAEPHPTPGTPPLPPPTDDPAASPSPPATAPASGDGSPPGRPAPDEAADPLAHVVDDFVDRGEATDWAAGQLVGGRSFDAVAADLSAGGWGPDDVEAIVEEAREATRRQRGLLTREDAVIRAGRQYYKSLRRVRLMIVLVLGGALLLLWLVFGSKR